ncbi:MAG: shikimate kinase [Acidobacteriota bacterium]
MRVFLTGFMGAGKTSVGRMLGRRLQLPFRDLDQEIERTAGRRVAEIFAREGEAGFRRREREELEGQCQSPRLVLATGGGTVVQPGIADRLRELGRVVWLRADFATLIERLERRARGVRPLFRDAAQARALYEARLPFYGQCDLVIEMGPREEPSEVAARVALGLEELVVGGR